MGLLSNSNAIESGGYNIERSLRFRSSASAYLNRTPASAGNRRTWTWSGWVKRGALGSAQRILFSSATGTTDSTHMWIGFAANTGGDELNVQVWNGSLLQLPMLFRDPASWYHIVIQFDTTQATQSNRIKVYVNGQLQTPTVNQAALNTDYAINSTQAHGLGYNNYSSGSGFFDGYLSEVNFIDGQALSPSSFGEFSTETGVWVPKKYTGTYGTNGFYLPFSDNTSATTLAYDKSGNGNNWTANNISTTAGATYDSMTDVPTLTSATAANYAVWNPLDRTAATYSEGNLKVVSSSAAAPYNMTASIAFPLTGKFYCEVTALVGGSNPLMGLGTNRPSDLISGYRTNGTYINNIAGASTSGTPSIYTTNDIIGIAYDIDAGTLSFYKNGVAQSGGISGIPANGYFLCVRADSASGDGGYLNCGQRPFSYTPPTGFKALNTFNLPDPVIKKPNQYMDATLWTGNGATRSITNSGSMQPDFVWIKSRSSATPFHQLQDAVRGATKQLFSNSTEAEDTNTTKLTSFNVDGFSLGTSGAVNLSSETYVGWQWKKGATPGFDIVTYTGNAVQGRQVSHSLGVAPKFIITKSRSAGGYDWNCWFTGFSDNQYIALNSTAAKGTDANTFPSAAGMTATYFTIGSGAWINGNGTTYVAYLFAEIPGYSKFGSYTGNGSADGPFVYCGFRPKYVMVKRTDSTSQWCVYDTSRNAYNQVNQTLYANLSNAEDTTDYIDILSNSFKARFVNADINNNGGTYIYAAFAENPFKYSLAR